MLVNRRMNGLGFDPSGLTTYQEPRTEYVTPAAAPSPIYTGEPSTEAPFSPLVSEEGRAQMQAAFIQKRTLMITAGVGGLALAAYLLLK